MWEGLPTARVGKIDVHTGKGKRNSGPLQQVSFASFSGQGSFPFRERFLGIQAGWRGFGDARCETQQLIVFTPDRKCPLSVRSVPWSCKRRETPSPSRG